MIRSCVVLVALTALWGWFPEPSLAVEPETWRIVGVEELAGTTRDSLGVTSRGYVELGLGRIPVALDATTIWAVEKDREGLWVGTGDDGGLYLLNRQGEVIHETHVDQAQVTALGRDAAGRLWVGTAPQGALYRWEADSLVAVAELEREYVWAIAPHGGNGVVVGTGGDGTVVTVDEDGEIELVSELNVQHVTGLTASGEDWIVTTDSPARLLRLSSRGEAKVLVSGAVPEFRSPVVLESGAIAYLANSQAGGGSLYQVVPEGAADLLWTLDNVTVHALAADAEGSLWFSLGSSQDHGSLIRLTPGDQDPWVELLTIPDSPATAFTLGEEGPEWIAGGAPGRVFKITESLAPAGTMVSPVHNAEAPARWGAISLEPPRSASGVGVETRSGNTSAPDATWSAWEAVSLDNGAGSVPSPEGQYLQWRLTLRSAQARVRGVRVAFVQKNQPPKIASFAVSELGAELFLAQSHMSAPGVFQDLPGGLRVEFQKSNSAKIPSAPDAAGAWARRYRTFTWRASDPNQDSITYDLFIRSQGSTTWLPIEQDLETSPYVWDSSTAPDGWYEARLEAGDSPANPPGMAHETSQVTEPFPVDNSRPVLEALTLKGSRLSGTVHDAMSVIKHLEYALDGQDWRQFFPRDGIPDELREEFELSLEALEPGRHVIQVRAVDAAGNVGVAHLIHGEPR